MDAGPIQAWTVPGSTPRASHRQAAVCRRSWMRRPRATSDQPTDRLNAEACNRCPDDVTNRCASASRSTAISRTSGRIRSATGTRRVLPAFARLRVAALRLGTLHDQHWHGHLGQVTHPDRPELGPTQARPGRDQQQVGSRLGCPRRTSRSTASWCTSSSSASPNGCISVRGPLARGTRVCSTGLDAMMRSRTAKAGLPADRCHRPSRHAPAPATPAPHVKCRTCGRRRTHDPPSGRPAIGRTAA